MRSSSGAGAELGERRLDLHPAMLRLGKREPIADRRAAARNDVEPAAQTTMSAIRKRLGT